MHLDKSRSETWVSVRPGCCRRVRRRTEPAGTKRPAGLRDLGVRFPTHDRITIDFARVDEGDLTGLGSGQDVGFRGELVRRDSRIELDEDLVPQGIEVLTRDGAEHGRESLRLVQVIGNEDGLEARVVREDRGGGIVRQLKHVDGDGLTIEESGYLRGSA